jgi:hypothetical protein
MPMASIIDASQIALRSTNLLRFSVIRWITGLRCSGSDLRTPMR